MNHNDFNDPAHLLSSTPSHLHYVPTNSMVIYLLNRTPDGALEVRQMLRLDITITTEQVANFLAAFNLGAHNFDAAILIAICDQRHDTHAGHLLNATRDGLHAAAIPVQRRISARNVTDTGHWLDIDTGEYGATYPYTDSLHVARAVHGGTHIRSSRSDIESEFSRITPAPPVHIGDEGALVITTTEEIVEILTAPSPIADPTLATRAGIIITAHEALRNAMIGLAVDHAQAAADLWTHIGRQLRGQPRAEALTLAAACLCLAGDTVRARFALEAAFDEAIATHNLIPDLGVMIEAMLEAGIGLAEIRGAILALTTPPASDGD